jgi:hypothetical protein
MATFLDALLLDKFSIIFTWVLIFAVVFAIIEATKVIQNKVLTATIAFCLATLAIATPSLPQILVKFMPWAIVVTIFVLFMLVLGNFMGVPTKEIAYSFGGRRAVWIVLTPLLVGLLFSLSNVFGQGMLSQRTGDSSTDTSGSGDSSVTTSEDASVSSSDHGEAVVLTLTNPKVLGLIALLIIALFAIMFLTGTPGLPYPRM